MTTRGDVARQCASVVTAALVLACAERRLPAPGAVPAVNAAERDLVLAARRLAAAVDDLPPGEMPRDWGGRKAS